jgi:hypothetical protein
MEPLPWTYLLDVMLQFLGVSTITPIISLRGLEERGGSHDISFNQRKTEPSAQLLLVS